MIETRRAALRIESLRRRGRIERVTDRFLQQRQPHFSAAVRFEGRRQQLGEQNLRLSKLLDDLSLGGHEVTLTGIRGRDSSCPCSLPCGKSIRHTLKLAPSECQVECYMRVSITEVTVGGTE